MVTIFSYLFETAIPVGISPYVRNRSAHDLRSFIFTEHHSSVSTGLFGSITVKFIDNKLVGSEVCIA